MGIQEDAEATGTANIAIRFVCPNCNSLMEAGTQRAGSKIHCKKCGRWLQIGVPKRAQPLAPSVEAFDTNGCNQQEIVETQAAEPLPDQWHYMLDGKQAGPVSGATLKQLAATGKFSSNDLVWKPGLASWVPAAKVKGLFGKHLHASPAPSARGSVGHTAQQPAHNAAARGVRPAPSTRVPAPALAIAPAPRVAPATPHHAGPQQDPQDADEPRLPWPHYVAGAVGFLAVAGGITWILLLLLKEFNVFTVVIALAIVCGQGFCVTCGVRAQSAGRPWPALIWYSASPLAGGICVLLLALAISLYINWLIICGVARALGSELDFAAPLKKCGGMFGHGKYSTKEKDFLGDEYLQHSDGTYSTKQRDFLGDEYLQHSDGTYSTKERDFLGDEYLQHSDGTYSTKEKDFLGDDYWEHHG
ncbi:MAG: GYF domain-containing protein [Gemmataceae bacterium]